MTGRNASLNESVHVQLHNVNTPFSSGGSILNNLWRQAGSANCVSVNERFDVQLYNGVTLLNSRVSAR